MTFCLEYVEFAISIFSDRRSSPSLASEPTHSHKRSHQVIMTGPWGKTSLRGHRVMKQEAPQPRPSRAGILAHQGEEYVKSVSDMPPLSVSELPRHAREDEGAGQFALVVRCGHVRPLGCPDQTGVDQGPVAEQGGDLGAAAEHAWVGGLFLVVGADPLGCLPCLLR